MTSNANKKLSDCRTCKGIVSKNAKTCPHCGEKKPYRDPRHVSPFISYTLLGLMVAYGVFSFSKGSLLSSAPQFSEGDKQQAWLLESQDGVRARLKDPSSAQFKDVFFVRWNDTPLACGHVNSKNTLGGYSGFQRFIASGKILVYLEEEVSDFEKAWQEMCR